MKVLTNAGVQGETGSLKAISRDIHYTIAGRDSTKPLLAFVHGSPGSSSNFLQYATDTVLLNRFQVLLIDRPGYGGSDFGQVDRSMESQAAEIAALIRNFTADSIFLVGHSLGGPIICRMAMDNPEQFSGLLIIAGSVDPDLEPDEPWRSTLDKKIFSWVLPRSFRVSNREIMPAVSELHKMDSLWPRITCDVIILQGEEDELVPPGNADYAEKMLINADVLKVMIPFENHFIPFTQPEMVREYILNLAGS